MTVNGKQYRAKPIDFNAVCDLEDMGISLLAENVKALSTARAYLAICMGLSAAEAGKEIEAHVLNGGNMDFMDELMVSFQREVDNSGFFLALSQTTQTGDQTSEIETETAPSQGPVQTKPASKSSKPASGKKG